MKVLHFESTGGASGDLVLGVLIDLGVDAERLQAVLSGLGAGPFQLNVEKAGSRGIHGTRVTVRVPNESGHPRASHHEKHHHHHHHHDSHAPHRGLKEIRRIIGDGDLSDRTRENSLKVFQRIAEAEAGIHGSSPEEVHFHEVGAMDSIVDIIGSCLALEWLGVDEIAVGALPLGKGTIHCQHGTYPCPAPATVELLKGHPVIQTNEPHEMVTPTGAALLTTWKTCSAPPPESLIIDVGYGVGHTEMDERPNVLRGTVLEAAADPGVHDSCMVLECNLDDMTPEWLGALAGHILEAGALDVFTTAVQMKKQRPGVLLTVLCHPDRRSALLDLIFRESTTFGVREYLTRRTMLDRRIVKVSTEYGTIRVKVGVWQGVDVTRSPEMDDCIDAAHRHNVPARVVYEAASRAASALEEG